MTHFLMTKDNPTGHKLEDILTLIRKDVIDRCALIADDPKAEAKRVMANNMEILSYLTEAIALAENSTEILDKSFGPSTSADGGAPRIGR